MRRNRAQNLHSTYWTSYRIHFSAAPISRGISFKWCVTAAAEMTKCQRYIPLVKKIAEVALQLQVAGGCVNGSSYQDCMAKIKAGEVDLITLDAEHLYEAGTLIHTM